MTDYNKMNKKQLTELVIIPTLKDIPNGLTPESVTAIQMIIAHESMRGEFLKQNKGPAMGLINMEAPTYADTWNRSSSIWKNALTLGFISHRQRILKIVPDINMLIYNLKFNVFMARQKLFIAPGALPRDGMEMGHYLKLNWNGDGKATASKYYNDFTEWV